jgi:endogenous inhibitor of DNA gyrase (YacG/DUF329 family)
MERPTLGVSCRNCGQLVPSSTSSEEMRRLEDARGGPLAEECPHCGQTYEYELSEYRELPPPTVYMR